MYNIQIQAVHSCLIRRSPGGDEYLCSKRSDKKGCEIGFGGGVNPDENPLTGLLRELREESGLCQFDIRNMQIAALGTIKLPRETAPNILVGVLIVCDPSVMDHFANFRPEMSGGEVEMVRWRKIGNWKIFEGAEKNEDLVRTIQVKYFSPLITEILAAPNI